MTRKKAAAEAAGIDPEVTYRVDLARSIRVGRATVTPGPRVRLLGAVLARAVQEDASAISGYEPAEV